MESKTSPVADIGERASAGGARWRECRSTGRNVWLSSQDAAQKVHHRRADSSDFADHAAFIVSGPLICAGMTI